MIWFKPILIGHFAVGFFMFANNVLLRSESPSMSKKDSVCIEDYEDDSKCDDVSQMVMTVR